MADKKPEQRHCTKCKFRIWFKMFRKKNHISRWVIQCGLFDEEVPINRGMECPEYSLEIQEEKKAGPVFEFQNSPDLYTLEWLLELRYKCNI